LLELSSFNFGHEIKGLMEESGEEEETVEEDWRRENDADEETIGIKVLLL
jgi:hypothetical protein